MNAQTSLACRLVRGELSASEVYRRALEKLGEQPGSGELRRIGLEHGLAAEELKLYCPEPGSPGGPGLWGWWAAALESLAQSFGDTAAVLALKRGEVLGLKDYERAVIDAGASAALRGTIESRLLPQTRAHLLALDEFLRLQRPQ